MLPSTGPVKASTANAAESAAPIDGMQGELGDSADFTIPDLDPIPEIIILPPWIRIIFAEHDYMLFDDANHGGWWYDAEKTIDNEDDNLLCWAAGASNVLEWTGWGVVDSLIDTDDMFRHYQEYFYNNSGNVLRAWEWWFNSSTHTPENDPTKVEFWGGGNYWPSENLYDYFHYEGDMTKMMSSIDSFLHSGYGVTIGIRPTIGEGGHVVTVWGYRYDPIDPDYYTGIWVTDSDDNKYMKSTDPPINTLRLYNMSYDSENGRWIMSNYGGGWYIVGVLALAPRPGMRPVAEAGALYTGFEGTPVTFDGSGSYDPDGGTLLYRWDFDNDGFWDTDFSASPTAEFTWFDDYDGTVLLEVFDGVFKDVDEFRVIISNVDPSITAEGDSIYENDYATVSGTIHDDGALDEFEITIDWGDGTVDTYPYSMNATMFICKHRYLDDNPTGTPFDIYTVTVTVTDDDGGSDTATTEVVVHNADPVVESISTAQPNPQFVLPKIHEVKFTADFHDKGTLDTHTFSWDFGDGSPVVTGSASAEHTFSAPGDYTVTFTVVDDDTGSASMSIVIQVSTPEEGLQETNEYIQTLGDGCFKNKPAQTKNALDNVFSSLLKKIAVGNYKGAISSLLNDVRAKADGAVGGNPQNDWIIDYAAQREICKNIDDIVEYMMLLKP